MRHEHRRWAGFRDLSRHIGGRRRRERRSRLVSAAPRGHHMFFGRDISGLKNLAPTVRKPPVPHHQHGFIRGNLARDGLHPIGSATRHNRHRIRVINLFQQARDVVHHGLKLGAHVVQRPVGEHHRVFQQAVGVDVGAQCGHGRILRVILLRHG